MAIRVRGRLCVQGAYDCLQHATHVSEHVVVPESQNAIVAIDQPSLADGIARISRMLAAVDLNDQAPFSTYKIDDIRPNGFLADKLESGQRAGTQAMPKP
jgi:hypothetical protein